MSPITTHILDTSLGKPASGVVVRLERRQGQVTEQLAQGITNRDGRIVDLVPHDSMEPGIYQLRYAIGSYFESRAIDNYFYPEIIVQFIIGDAQSHYHVPLLISPFGYSTYRGS